MWSGPRNLSTALMRSFGQRDDCAVIDEPFYAHYLSVTGIDHPMTEDVIAAGDKNAEAVIKTLLGPVPDGRGVYYQKHMLQHLIPGVPRGWIGQVTNVFLIRHPARVIHSYAKRRERPTVADLGFVQQRELFDQLRASDASPVIIDASDIRRDPPAGLAALCRAVGLEFQPAMLAWPEGPHPGDGIWGKHWYRSIWNSTGFDARPEPDLPDVGDTDLLRAGLDIYEEMQALKLHF